MFKVGDIVICAYAGDTDKLNTHGEYKVVNVPYKGTHIEVECTNTGEFINGTYLNQRFMSKDSMVKQVLENARND